MTDGELSEKYMITIQAVRIFKKMLIKDQEWQYIVRAYEQMTLGHQSMSCLLRIGLDKLVCKDMDVICWTTLLLIRNKI